MTIQQIKYIISVAENGSLNRASEKLFISQPSLTASIHDAENELAFQIFIRSARGVTVTAKGEEFIDEAKSVYRSFEALIKKYSGTHKTFSVAALYYPFARKAFIELVRKFTGEGWEFALREMKACDVISDVENGHSEIGIIYVSDSTRAEILKTLSSRRLCFNHLAECKALVYLHKNHPLSKQANISLEELSKYQFVTFDTDDAKMFFSDELLERYNLKNPIMVADRATELNLIKNLNGYTFLSGIAGEDTNEEFITIPLKNLEEKAGCFELGYITRENAKMNYIERSYIDAVQRAVQGEIPSI